MGNGKEAGWLRGDVFFFFFLIGRDGGVEW